MKEVECKDDAVLVKVRYNEYGDPELEEQTNVKVLFRHGMSSIHASFVETISTDGHAYISLHNPFVARNMERVEGMYLIINRYGEDVWYKIERCVVGRTLLTDNVDNNLHVFLSKSPALVDLEST